VKFLIDNQLPPALANFLIRKGHLAEHVFDIGLSEANDTEIYRHAAANSLIIVSKDEDFSRKAL
jgi:predicted nuclease of predicted toxin-antitoxin system